MPFLADPAIQAVVISAPAAQHYALATQALDAGKHCEENILMVGNPARQIGSVCECGGRLDDTSTCVECKKTLEYKSLTTISE